MVEKETLSEKIDTLFRQAGNLEIVQKKDIKEKIQNAQRRLKEYIRLTCVTQPFNLIEEINKIFLEEFGDKLI